MPRVYLKISLKWFLQLIYDGLIKPDLLIGVVGDFHKGRLGDVIKTSNIIEDMIMDSVDDQSLISEARGEEPTLRGFLSKVPDSSFSVEDFAGLVLALYVRTVDAGEALGMLRSAPRISLKLSPMKGAGGNARASGCACSARA